MRILTKEYDSNKTKNDNFIKMKLKLQKKTKNVGK